MKQNLLEMTQDILSDMSDDNVNDVNDTANALRVVQILKSQYYKKMGEQDWPHLGNLIQLTGLGDITQPTKVLIPESTRRVSWIKYDVRLLAGDAPRFADINHLTPKEFMDFVQSRNSQDVDVTAYTESVSGISLNIRTDIAPRCWTSFDDEFIVFDAYDSALEASIQQSKLASHGIVEPAWVPNYQARQNSKQYILNQLIVPVAANGYYYKCVQGGVSAASEGTFEVILGGTTVDGGVVWENMGGSDMNGFIPDMPTHMFSGYLSDCKVQCFSKIKQVTDQVEMRDGKRQRVVEQQTSWRQNGKKEGKSYGRK